MHPLEWHGYGYSGAPIMKVLVVRFKEGGVVNQALVLPSMLVRQDR